MTAFSSSGKIFRKKLFCEEDTLAPEQKLYYCTGC